MKLFLDKKNPFYKIYISFILFGITLFTGIAGFFILFDYPILDACYMTVITLAAVGYGFLDGGDPVNDQEKLFIICLILTNLTIFTYFITVVSRFFLDGEFIKVYKNIRMKKSVHELDGHTIICGFGRNGLEAARVFAKNNMEFVVIEKSSKNLFESMPDLQYYFEADATRDEVLIEAGIKNAKALITTLPDDAANVFVVLTAHELNPHLKIISRASNDTSVKKLKRAGAHNVIMPDKIGGAHMAGLILSPDVKEFIDMLSTTVGSDFKLTEIEVGRSILLQDADSWNKTGATILGVKSTTGEYTLNPPSHFELKPYERIIAMGSQKQLAYLQNLVGKD